MLLLFWLPRVPRYRFIAGWCRLNLWARALDLRHPVPRDRRREHPAARRPHIVMSKHSSTWETLALNLYFPPLAFVAKKELLSIPFFGWGFALASPITIDRKAGTDAMAADRRRRAASASRRASGSSSIPEGTRIRAGTRAQYKTGGARLAHRRCACRSCRSRTMPATCGRRASSASGPERSRCRSASRSRPRARTLPTLIARSRGVDRGRSRAARRPARDG